MSTISVGTCFFIYKLIHTKEVVIFGVTHGTVRKEIGDLKGVLIFYKFCLSLLFVSINLLSMHDPKFNKSLAYSRNTKKEEYKYKDVLLSSPSSVPYFKQQSIALHNNDANQYPLIFNRNQHPCITQYLLEGKPVAKLIQIDDEINFEGDDYRAYNFSLQIPYQAGSLTINTQSRFIFEKKIDAYSAYITPDFCLASATKDQVCLKDFNGKWVVLFFYVKDNTSG